MNTNDRPLPGLREIVRWWPLIVLPALIAVAAGILSASQQAPSYTATTRMEVLPLAQWDETFLGTSLIRDAGDATLTAATTAAVLDSRRTIISAQNLVSGWTPEQVAASVKVSPVASTNAIEIVAKAPDAERARQLSEGFAKAVLEDRWNTIWGELDSRIVAMKAAAAAAPDFAELSTRVQTLTATKESGWDPTLRISSTGAAVPEKQMSVGLVAAVAGGAGLLVGLLAVVAILRLRRYPRATVSEPGLPPGPTPAPAYSMNLEH